MASNTTDAEMIEPISYKTVTVKTYKVGYVNTSEGSQAGSSEILSPCDGSWKNGLFQVFSFQ